MNELILPPAYADMLRKACERAYKKGLKRGKRAGHANGHAAGRDELINGLKALAQLNGTAAPVARITKAFDESKVVRDAHGRFATKEEIAEAASDPEKRKQLESNLDDENKAKLAAAIDEHNGKPQADSSTTHAEAAEGLKKLHALHSKKGGTGPSAFAGTHEQKKLHAEAVAEAADYVLKLNREELTNLKESLSLKVGGRKADIADAVARKVMNSSGMVTVGQPKQEEYAKPTAAHFEKIAKESAFDKEVQANVERIKRETADEPAPGKELAVPATSVSSPLSAAVAAKHRELRHWENALEKVHLYRPGSTAQKKVLARIKQLQKETGETVTVDYPRTGGEPIPKIDTEVLKQSRQTALAMEQTFKKMADATKTGAEQAVPTPALPPAEPTPEPASPYPRSAAGDLKPETKTAAYWIDRRAKEGKPLSADAAARLQADEKAGAMITAGDVQVAEHGNPPQTLATAELFERQDAAKAATTAPSGDPKEQQIRGKIEQYSRWLEEAKRGEGMAGPTRWTNNAIHQKNYLEAIDFHEKELAKHLASRQATPPAGAGPHVVTGGNTYQHRQLLSAIGGRWDMTKRRWVVPAAALAKLPPGLRGVPL